MTTSEIVEEILNKYQQKSDGRILVSKNITQLQQNTVYIAGVDEAGRGPVLGPMVYCIFYCAPKFEAELRGIKCNDSKSMNDHKRKEIFDWICKHLADCGFVLNIIPPNFISTSMLSWVKYDLNTLSHDTVVELIDSAQNETNGTIQEIFIDTVGPAESYQAYLKARINCKNTKLHVSTKADSKFVVVGAASICAKVVRDTILEKLVERYKQNSNYPGDIGSGYPSDPKTMAWIASIRNPFSGFPDYLVRFSWKTIQSILEKKLTIKWPTNKTLTKKKRKSTSDTHSTPNKPPPGCLLTQFNLSPTVDWKNF